VAGWPLITGAELTSAGELGPAGEPGDPLTGATVVTWGRQAASANPVKDPSSAMRQFLPGIHGLP
jgi:hypothetical protein